MPLPAQPPSVAPRRSTPNDLRARIVAVGVVLIVAFAASSAYDVWRSYSQIVSATDRELTNLSKALAQEAGRSFQTVDVLLRDTADWYEANGNTITPEGARESLKELAAGLSQVRGLAIADAQGIIRYSSRTYPAPALDISDRSHFIVQRDSAAAGLSVSDPIVTRADHRMALVLSRRLEVNGRFAGIVSALVNLDDFEQFYRAIDLGATNTISLLRDDGVLIARQPSAPNAIGKKFPELAVSRDQATARITSPIDGGPRFVAVASVRGFPFVAMVSRDQTAAMAPWREQTVHVTVRTLALSLLAALVIAALVQQLARVEAGEQALRESEERYALVMEGSNEGHWDWDLATDRLFLSPKMKQLHGRRADDS